MGNCQAKTTTVEAVEVITHDKYNTFYQPNNPNEDKEEKYIWLTIHSTRGVELQKYQEDGFVIAYEDEMNKNGRLWIRKERE